MTHLELADSSADSGSTDVEWGQQVTYEEYEAAALRVSAETTAE